MKKRRNYENEAMFDFDSFAPYYKEELDADVHRPPREINHEKLKKR